MPRIDFNKVDPISSFAPVPEGEYICRLSDVETDVTRAGDTMWRLRWIVEGGEHDGRILFDTLNFSRKAMPRVRLVCESCGLNTSGAIELEPAMLLEKQVRVTTFVEQYTDEHGTTKARNRIPFGGYRAVGEIDDDLPF